MVNIRKYIHMLADLKSHTAAFVDRKIFDKIQHNFLKLKKKIIQLIKGVYYKPIPLWSHLH